jgi:RNA 2',3'-cyclic 3'-phosphodiesterase
MSASNLRLFVAVDIPEEIREVISCAVQNLKGEVEGARWVKSQNLHLTLKFIGNFEEDRLDRLISEIYKVTERSMRFTTALGGCGAFPSTKKARVIWIGMTNGDDEAGTIARKIDKRLERLGIEREGRPFRSHLTLARLKQPRDCTSQLENLDSGLKGLPKMSFDVGEITLYQSDLGPQGPTYNSLRRLSLGGT